MRSNVLGMIIQANEMKIEIHIRSFSGQSAGPIYLNAYVNADDGCDLQKELMRYMTNWLEKVGLPTKVLPLSFQTPSKACAVVETRGFNLLGSATVVFSRTVHLNPELQK
jgi:hypothetical protein